MIPYSPLTALPSSRFNVIHFYITSFTFGTLDRLPTDYKNLKYNHLRRLDYIFKVFVKRMVDFGIQDSL